MLALGIVLTVIVLALVAVLLIMGETPSEFAAGVVLGVVGPVVATVLIRYHYWSTISSAVECTPRQFPELYQVYRDLALEMGFREDGEGLEKLPRLYIANGNGSMNAFAAKCRLRRGYVVLYSDIVDIAYTHGDFGAMRFVLAHELGHIKCRHVSLWRAAIRPVMEVLRLEPSVTRAQEYTADRVALYYAPDCADSMVLLCAGKHLTHRVNMDEYYKSIDAHKDGFWLKLSNFLVDHAVGFRRMQAIREAKTHGWDVHGKML
ncbi:peptidase M48 [Corynebacterium sp. 13CS0277]|nr:peptidase M48 [Corynebacterium sp. 13CS0277]